MNDWNDRMSDYDEDEFSLEETLILDLGSHESYSDFYDDLLSLQFDYDEPLEPVMEAWEVWEQKAEDHGY